MRKRWLKTSILILFLVLLQIMAVYVGLSLYYRNAFEYGTWINGVYCTGKSIDEVNEELAAQFQYDGITIIDKYQNTYYLNVSELEYQFDFKEALKLYLDRQNSWLWIDSFWKVRQDTLSPVVSYDKEKLTSCLEQIPFLQAEKEAGRNIVINKTPQGYELVDERADVLNIEEAKEAVKAAVADSRTTISLAEANCYHDLELTPQMEEVLKQWELVEEFQNCGIVYQMGEEQVPVDASVVCDWILLDENGNFALDANGALQLQEGAVEEFVNFLADEYDTLGKHTFHTSNNKVVTIEGGTYGNKLDRKAEIAYLEEAFAKKSKEVHTPVYEQMAQKQGKDDIGDTYIEINMTSQMMYYYQSGELVLETPVVTGNTSRRMGTPEGVNYVYLKQKDRVLRGPGYASHVNFWMPVKGNIGIHDAAWRSNYGGEIYKTNGSHGCINTPYAVMEQLYEMAEVGTPVVMFYE